jgi:hypothetical protein
MWRGPATERSRMGPRPWPLTLLVWVGHSCPTPLTLLLKGMASSRADMSAMVLIGGFSHAELLTWSNAPKLRDQSRKFLTSAITTAGVITINTTGRPSRRPSQLPAHRQRIQDSEGKRPIGLRGIMGERTDDAVKRLHRRHGHSQECDCHS